METISIETQPARETTAAGEQFVTCEQCQAPLEHSQRYCVVCGTRHKHASDPATRFMGGAASRARVSGPASPPRGTARRRRAGLGTALAIAVVPAAVAAGVLVGRAGNGTDANLLAALRAQKAEVVNIGAGTGTASTGSTGSTTSASTTSRHNGKASTGKVLSSTKYGSFHSVAGLSKPSQSQLNQNSQIVRRVQSTINSSYVNSQKNLPNQIAVP